jgi:hypothetical protein
MQTTTLDSKLLVIHLQNELSNSKRMISGVLKTAERLQSQYKIQHSRTSPEVAEFIKGLINKGAKIPRRQAQPVKKKDLYLLKQRLPFEIWIVYFLAFKAASRIGEIVKLRGKYLKVNRKKRTIQIDWLNLPKGAARRPFAESNLTLLKFREDQLEEFEYLSALRSEEPLTLMKTMSFYRILKKLGHPFDKWGAHSFKRGAADTIMENMTPLDPRLPAVPRLLKHKVVAPVLPDVTVQYCSNREAVANALGTGSLTTYL